MTWTLDGGACIDEGNEGVWEGYVKVRQFIEIISFHLTMSTAKS